MKKNMRQTDIENAELIMKLLGKHDDDYKLERLNYMLNYTKQYCNGNMRLQEHLIKSTAYQNWWNNHWNRANEWLVNRYWLRSYIQRVKAGLPVRITWDDLVLEYEKVHSITPEDTYPSTAIYELADKEAQS